MLGANPHNGGYEKCWEQPPITGETLWYLLHSYYSYLCFKMEGKLQYFFTFFCVYGYSVIELLAAVFLESSLQEYYSRFSRTPLAA